MENISNQEELVLLSVGALYPDAYAYAIKEEIKKESGKNMSLGTIHTILYRLENEGLLKSHMGGSSNKRGGRSKRLFSLTAKGYQMAEDLRKLRQSLWSRISPDQISF
ncbi:MAG: PadR family transcriptional regulator [Cytophagales bacterium]|nr:PadR family transcriptional regulator [Cytophagales bacterium]